MDHVIIYKKEGRYAGWPANYGIWSWGNEIVLAFTVGYHKSKAGFHSLDKSKPFMSMQARSLDGGRAWAVRETPCRKPGGRGLSADEHMNEGMGVGDVLDGRNAPKGCPGGIDFLHPDFALMCAKTGLSEGVTSFFYTSTNRCYSWRGPYQLPMFCQKGIAARTDYLVSGPAECMLFLTANKRNGLEGRVFCAKTANGGKSFHFVAWIGPEPEGFSIMPASVRISPAIILIAVRCRGAVGRTHEASNWIDLWASNDRGATWRYQNTPVANTGKGGNPPTLTKLQDGRLCLTYGYRDAPYGIRAKLSQDDGRTWSEEIILRDDAGSHDIGYPRTVQRPDGKVLTAYYYNDHPNRERYIAATIWDP